MKTNRYLLAIVCFFYNFSLGNSVSIASGDGTLLNYERADTGGITYDQCIVEKREILAKEGDSQLGKHVNEYVQKILGVGVNSKKHINLVSSIPSLVVPRDYVSSEFSLSYLVKHILSSNEKSKEKIDQTSIINFLSPLLPQESRWWPSGYSIEQDKVEEFFDPDNENYLDLVAIVNRIDAARVQVDTCGEVRFIFSKKPLDEGANEGNNYYLIFESAIRNPYLEKHSEVGQIGSISVGIPSDCFTIAKDWLNLSASESKAQLTIDVMSFINKYPEFFDWRSFGKYGKGKVAAHMDNLDGGDGWILRQWKIGDQDQSLKLLDSNLSTTLPLEEPFKSRYESSTEFTLKTFPSLAFSELNPQTAFLFKNLTIQEFIINNIFGIENYYLNLPYKIIGYSQEIDLGFVKEYKKHLDTYAKYRPLSLGFLTGEMLANRLNASTCSGCHKTSSTNLIAGGNVKWPVTNFVHFFHDGSLSDALISYFLPFRKEIFINLLCQDGLRKIAEPLENYKTKREQYISSFKSESLDMNRYYSLMFDNKMDHKVQVDKLQLANQLLVWPLNQKVDDPKSKYQFLNFSTPKHRNIMIDTDYYQTMTTAYLTNLESLHSATFSYESAIQLKQLGKELISLNNTYQPYIHANGIYRFQLEPH